MALAQIKTNFLKDVVFREVEWGMVPTAAVVFAF